MYSKVLLKKAAKNYLTVKKSKKAAEKKKENVSYKSTKSNESYICSPLPSFVILNPNHEVLYLSHPARFAPNHRTDDPLSKKHVQ